MLKKLNRLWSTSFQKIARQQRKRVQSALKKVYAKRPGNPPAVRKVSRPVQSTQWKSGYASRPGSVRQLRYRLFLPMGDAALASAPVPMIVMLHGCQQTADEFAAGTGMNRLAASKGYAVLYPEQSVGTHPRRCWKWYDAETQRGDGDIATIAHLVEGIAAHYAIDPGRIYACGMSAGAGMAHILALTRPDLIAAVGMHSGPVFGVARSAAGAFKVMQQGASRPLSAVADIRSSSLALPAIIISGSRDNVVRAVNLRQLEEQFVHLNQTGQRHALLSNPVVAKEFGRISAKSPRKRRMLIRDHLAGRTLMIRSVEIEGLGHAWSGGDDTMPFHAKGPDASRMMLDFFGRHRLRAQHAESK